MEKIKLQLGQDAIQTFDYELSTGILSSDTTHHVGYSAATMHRMYMTVNLPTLPPAAKITKAELSLRQAVCGFSGENKPAVAMYQVSQPLVSGQAPADHNSKILDYFRLTDGGQESGTNVEYTLDITNLLQESGCAGNTVYLVLKLADESIQTVNYTMLHGCESTVYAPCVSLEYELGYDVSMNDTTHTHSLGRFGTVGIDLQSGNLLMEAEDFTWSGNRMPVALQHLYTGALAGKQFAKNSDIGLNTADFSAMKLGHGWRLNMMQSIIPHTVVLEEENDNGYLYMDEVGNEYFFVESDVQEDKRVNEEQVEYYLFKEQKDGELKYDPVKRELYVGDETFTFDESGRLVEVKDQFGNAQTIQYTEGQIDYILDGAGRKFDFTYLDGFLTQITAPDNTALSYAYTNDLLTCLTYPDGRKAQVNYNANGQPVSVVLKDASGIPVYKVEYTYSGNSVISVKEIGYQDGNEQEGQHTTYEYSAAAGSTKVNTYEKEEDTSTEVVTTTTVYTFNEEGEMVGNYVYTTDTGNVSVNNGNSGTIHPYAGENGMGVVSNINNLLKNHSFADTTQWQPQAANDETFLIRTLANQSYAMFGNRVLRMSSSVADAVANGVYQETVVLPVGNYVFSAYLRPLSNLSGSDCAYLRVTDVNGTVLAESDRLTKAERHLVRLEVPFTLTQAQSVQVHLLMDGDFTMYADGAQLENNQSMNDYNMLENGNFELGNHGWNLADGEGASLSTEEHFNMSHALQLQGSVNEERRVSQTVPVKSCFNTKETFTLSGWAKANSVPLTQKTDGGSPSFCLKAIIHYTDGEQQVETAGFAPCTCDWQLASVTVEKNRCASVDSLEIVCEYNYNDGKAYFDDIQLVRNSWENDVPAEEFGSAKEEEGESSTEETETDATESDTREETNGFEEAVDAFGNSLTETTFTEGEFGTMYRSFAFDATGNDLVKEVDAKGKETAYTVNGQTSRKEEVVDRCGNKTAYEYDVNGRTTKVICKDPTNIAVANVSYAYDAFDNMTEIVRGDGMKYTLSYNAFHNLQSIGIDGKDTPLVTYAYKNGNGRLKEMTYANNDRMEATYNGLGQMIGETWYDQWGTKLASYKYVYDGAGNITQTLDITNGKLYTYVYEKGVLVTAKEYDATYSNDLVTAKTLVCSIAYHYNDDGQMVQKVMTWNNPEGVPREYTLSYEYPENGDPVVTFGAGLPDVVFHSKSDSFGRKEFEELQLRKGFSYRQFVYQSGEATQIHKDNAKLKSSPTTGLVKEIVFSDGSTLSYEYDAEERITKVTEVYTLKEPEVTDEGVIFHERSVTDVTEYTYDVLGQLLTETKNGVVINQMTYDNYGNIRSKNGKTYSYGYGDPNWKDLLTQVDGKWIDYDKQGNPIIYMDTHSLYWGKGRELSCFIKCDEDYNEVCRCDYTYNANGIRTSKTVNNIRHDYLLEGTKILRETWQNKTLIPLYDNQEQVCGISYNGNLFSFLKNLQGDVIGLVDDNGETVARYSYDAWGVPTVLEDHTDIQITNVNPYLYRTYYYDWEIGMYYLQSRYYDPTIGRFINADDAIVSLFELENLIQYDMVTYCWNNPINLFDDEGIWPKATWTKTTNYISIQITVPWQDIETYFTNRSYTMAVIGIIACFIPEPTVSKAIGVVAGIDSIASAIISAVIAKKKKGKSIRIGISFNYKIKENKKYIYIINSRWVKLGYWYKWKTVTISNFKWWVKL